ncbi:60S ribosomal protein L31-like [Acomys russatus]|uniref:60S ribosomal protein L31-like n=1 Tax=Acomys russatus TaxID=60746 RepID=UPI0021E31A39|nr:60S ribosomal protein L31-like [Acomys russatus]
MAPSKKGGEKKVPSAMKQGGDPRAHHQHSQTHPWSGLQEVCSSGTQRNSEICHEGDGDSRCARRHQGQQRCMGPRNEECSISHPSTFVQKQNEDEDSSNKLYTLVTYVPVVTFKNLQTVYVDEN